MRIKCSTKGCYSHSVRGLREIRAKVVFDYIYHVLGAGISLEGEKAYNQYVADAKRQLVDSAKELGERPTLHLKQINDLEAQIEEQQLIVVRRKETTSSSRWREKNIASQR